ncbi:hypothetical protein [Serratia marcescens]|uniref:hypothetical protein n=1 Tax=Serratia marcescens TaxID=615 RepID=UPI001BAFCE17|nr:hypothetical protein [Serratia marcescens]MBS3895097.1 hypothetical protein [Serratia marcescens]
MTRTLTTEQLNDYARVFRKDAERWVEKGEPEIAQELHALADEIDALAANREAQPVAWQETLSRAAKAFEALLETAGHFDKEVWADVPAQLRTLTAPPAPAVANHVGDTNEKAAEKCECSSIDYCENCLRRNAG